MDRFDEALATVPRAAFLPQGAGHRAAHDGPVSIGHGQTSSQPRAVESMLRLLDPEPGHRVLDVGSGSGWTTALLAHLVGTDGRVLGVERVPELARWGADNVTRSAGAWASVREATPGVLGAPDEAPWDRILVSAGAETLPEALVDQLAANGRMVVPVAGEMLLVERAGGQVRTSRHGPYRFVPLIEDQPD